MHILRTSGFLFFLSPPLFSRPRRPGSPPSAHLTCSILIVGHVTATLVKLSRVAMETLLWLRLHDRGKGVGSESPISGAPDLCSLRSEGDSGRWKGRLLKLPEPRQAREGLHDAQQLLVLELVVLKAAGRPSPSALGWGPLEAPAGKGQAWPPSWGRHNIGSQKELVTCSMVFNRSSWEERPSAGLDTVLIPSLWGVPAWWPQGPSGWTVKAS